MISQASRRLYILTMLKSFGVSRGDLVFVYTTYIRPLMEFCAPVWGSSITAHQSTRIERVQKRALRMIASPEKYHYDELLVLYDIPTLESRRTDLILSFGKSLLLSDRHRGLLPSSRQSVSRTGLRNGHKLTLPKIRTKRYAQSSIPAIVNLLNSL